MRTFTKESNLLAPVCFHFGRQGFKFQSAEVQFFEYKMDFFCCGSDPEYSIAVELKLTKWIRAFEQALIYQLCADFVYLALPHNNALKADFSLLREHGLGLLGVKSKEECTLLIEARQTGVIQNKYRDFYIDKARRSSL